MKKVYENVFEVEEEYMARKVIYHGSSIEEAAAAIAACLESAVPGSVFQSSKISVLPTDEAKAQVIKSENSSLGSDEVLGPI